jgi:hypothetical protein
MVACPQQQMDAGVVRALHLHHQQAGDRSGLRPEEELPAVARHQAGRGDHQRAVDEAVAQAVPVGRPAVVAREQRRQLGQERQDDRPEEAGAEEPEAQPTLQIGDVYIGIELLRLWGADSSMI